jgi:uncharacterized DUF497 family protein
VIIEFDPVKSAANAKDRGLPFMKVDSFGWEGALFSEDSRFAYPERRVVALGFLADRLHVVCFTPISGGVRVISFRKANKREVRRYEQATSDGRER